MTFPGAETIKGGANGVDILRLYAGRGSLRAHPGREAVHRRVVPTPAARAEPARPALPRDLRRCGSGADRTPPPAALQVPPPCRGSRPATRLAGQTSRH